MKRSPESAGCKTLILYNRELMHRKTLILSILLVAIYITLVEPYWMKITHREIRISKLNRPIRILFLSDLQLKGEYGIREKWILNQAKELSFDIVLTTGDLFDKPEGMPAAVEFMSQFPPRAPTYAVLGNWEHWSKADLTQYKIELAKRKVHLLVDENDTFEWNGSTISILGVNDSSQNLHNLPLAMKGTTPDSFRILLAHGPVIFPLAAPNAIDFMLAGHTHGGQVRIPFMDPFYLPPGCGPYSYGTYKQGKSTMLVTSGVGTSILPVRFWCRPEIVVITLTPLKV